MAGPAGVGATALCLRHFFLAADACLMELKFAIYYRAASLPSQASYAVLTEESQAFFKLANSISNSAILRNNYISLLSDLCGYVHVKKKWRRKGSHRSVYIRWNGMVEWNSGME